MTNGEKIQEILDIDRDCVEVYGENGTMTFTVKQEWWNAECKELTTKNNLGVNYTINGLDDFIKFGKKAFGVELAIKKSDNPDTYEKLFGTTKNDLAVDCNNCKNNLHRGDGTSYCATGDGMCHYECEEPTRNNLGVDIDKLIVDCEKMSFDIDFFNKPFKVVALDAVKNIVNELPSVTPQERKGHWIKIKSYPLQMHEYECSECGHETDDNTESYCSDCGAKMFEPQESEE